MLGWRRHQNKSDANGPALTAVMPTWIDRGRCYLSNNAAAAGSSAAVLIHGGEGGVLFADDAAAAGPSAVVLVDGGKDRLLSLVGDGGERVH